MVASQLGCNMKQIVVGYHKPPFNSVHHLHLHVGEKPFRDPKHEICHFGNWMIDTKKSIEYLNTYGSVYKGCKVAKKKAKEAKFLSAEVLKQKAKNPRYKSVTRVKRKF